MGAAQNLKPWKPGQTGNAGGRPKRLLPRVDEMLKAAGKDPIKEILALIPGLKDREQVQIWLELLPYVHAKVKPTEEHEENELEKMSDEELWDMLKKQKKMKEAG